MESRGSRQAHKLLMRRRRAFFAFVAVFWAATFFGSSTPVSRALAGPQTNGGVLLDGYGGLHPFGGATLNTAGAPYWGWNIARAISVLPGGSGGWTLDGWGGIHPWGAPPRLNTTSSPYWKGWDIARALVVLPGGTGGYELDGWGGIHAFGAAPTFSGSPYWKGFDIARGLDIHYSTAGVPDGGWVLDGWGGIHPFGAAPPLATSQSHYYLDYDFWRHLHVTGNGRGAYVVGKYGIVDRLADPPGTDWTGLPHWGNWDIAWDIVPLNPAGVWSDQPVDRPTAGAAMVDLMNFDRAQNGLPRLAESATLDGIEGNGLGYNLVGCGVGNIPDRTLDMLSRNYFSHEIPLCGPKTVRETYLNFYFPTWNGYGGENIAWTGGRTSLADTDWFMYTEYMHSPEHQRNILSATYTQIGCGTAYSAATTYQATSGPIFVNGCIFIS